MIVGMNYTQDGNRAIAFIDYYITLKDGDLSILASNYNRYYDEVYVVDFNPYCEDFINEIVLKGCRA